MEQLFYNSEISERDNSIILSKEESTHIHKVLKKNKGDNISITNGRGTIFTLQISEIKTNRIIATITDKIFEKPIFEKPIHLAMALIKSKERQEWCYEKITELGVSEITPLLCDQAERKVFHEKRVIKKMVAAIKQSQQAYLPKLNPPISCSQFLTNHYNGYIAHCNEDNIPSFQKGFSPNKENILMIGPEGDFSLREVQLAKEKGFQEINLGKQRFRAETASVIGLYSLVLQNQ